MWGMIIGGIFGGLSAYSSNKTTKMASKAAESAAKINAKLAYQQFATQAGYLNEELGQEIKNTYENMLQSMGTQKAAMGASGFDISTGDQRIMADTYNRNMDRQSGMRRTAYLQNFENERQALSDVLQYNFQAWSARQQRKNVSGLRGAAKIGIGVATGALGQFNPTKFGGKGRIASNTGASSTTYPSQYSTNAQLQRYLDASTKLQF